MQSRRSRTGFVCIFSRSLTSQALRPRATVVHREHETTKNSLSLAPLKFKEAVSDLLKIKPEPKRKPKPKAKRKAK